MLEYVQGMLIVKSFNLGQNSNSKMRQAILDSKDKNLKLERTVPYNMLQQIILSLRLLETNLPDDDLHGHGSRLEVNLPCPSFLFYFAVSMICTS